MHGHCISENKHMNESPDCNEDWLMNQNSSNEMAYASLSSKAPCYFSSPLSICRTFLDFSIYSEEFSGNIFFEIF